MDLIVDISADDKKVKCQKESKYGQGKRDKPTVQRLKHNDEEKGFVSLLELQKDNLQRKN